MGMGGGACTGLCLCPDVAAGVTVSSRLALTTVHMGVPACLKVKVTQLCPTLCESMDYTLHGIVQAKILEWVAFPFSRVSSQPRIRTRVSCIAGRFFTD